MYTCTSLVNRWSSTRNRWIATTSDGAAVSGPREADGPSGLIDPSSIAFVEMFAVADQMLGKREAYGFGELHIDNSKSFSTHQFARKIQFDNPVVRKMFDLANKHGAALQFHMQGDDSANNEALSMYLNEFPNAKVILSHSMPWSKQLLLKELLSKHKTLFLELPQKGSALGAREAAISNCIGVPRRSGLSAPFQRRHSEGSATPLILQPTLRIESLRSTPAYNPQSRWTPSQRRGN